MNISFLPKQTEPFSFEEMQSAVCSKRFLQCIIAIVLFHIIACVSLVYLSFKEAVKIQPTKLHVKTVALKSERPLQREIKKEEVEKSPPEEAYVAYVPENKPEVVLQEPEVVKKVAAPKPTEVKKVTAKKIAPKQKKKPAPVKKQQVEKKPVKAKETSAKVSEVKKIDEAKLQIAKENERRKKLIAQALTNLGDANAVTFATSDVVAIAPVAKVATLQTDSLVIEDAKENSFANPSERSYYDELVSRLQLGLKLPEYGSVKVKLTVTKEGKVVGVHICETKSQKNSKYVEKKVKTLSFPPFGVNFQNEKEHTFYLNLSNG